MSGATGSRRRRASLLAVALGLSGLIFTAVALAATGDLTQKADPDGCITDTGSAVFGCSTGKALDGATSVTVSPDGALSLR